MYIQMAAKFKFLSIFFTFMPSFDLASLQSQLTTYAQNILARLKYMVVQYTGWESAQEGKIMSKTN